MRLKNVRSKKRAFGCEQGFNTKYEEFHEIFEHGSMPTRKVRLFWLRFTCFDATHFT